MTDRHPGRRPGSKRNPLIPGKLHSDVEGDIEEVDGKMVVTRIRVHYNIKVPKGREDDARKLIDIVESACPAALSVKRGIELEYSADISEE